MATEVIAMTPAEVVHLVNEWGTLPREIDGRNRSEGPPTVLADELYPIFAAGRDAERAALVTALLRATGVRPELSPALTASWSVADPAQAPRAAAALALRHHLATHPGRMGVCADTRCADVYVDASPAGRRRFCCLTCQNRARATAFRARHRPA